MSTLLLDSPSSVSCDSAMDSLTLLISGGGVDSQVVRLSSAKCTVGSGVTCTLRLLGPGIRPLHLLIVRGTRGTFVRRWSPDTWLNGRPFEDAALRAGDRLRVGPVILEVLQPESSTHEPISPAALVTRSVPSAVPSAAHSENEISQLSDDDRAQIESLRGRARRLVDALRTSRQQQKELESRVQTSLAAQREAEEKLRELQTSAREADGRSDGFSASVESLRSSVAELSNELETQKEQQRVLIEQLELAQSREAALKLGTQAGNASREVQAARGKGGSESSSPPAHKCRDDGLVAIDRLREHSVGKDPTLPKQVRSCPPDEEASHRSATPASFMEQYAPHLLDDAACGREAAQAQSTVRSDARTAANIPIPIDAYEGEALSDNTSPPRERAIDPSGDPHTAAISGDDEESLEEYMAKLMQRVRGSDRGFEQFQADQPFVTQHSHAPTPATVGRYDAGSSPAAPLSAERSVFRLEDIKRAAPPERRGHFAAMRELANQSAHRALSRSRMVRGTRDGTRRLLASGMCLASGIGILWWTPEALTPAGAGGVAAILASVYFAIGGIWSLLTTVLDNSDAEHREPSADTNETDGLGGEVLAAGGNDEEHRS